MANTIEEAIERATTGAEPLMSLDEVALFLRVPKESVRLWRAKGQGPRSYKVGRHVRYRREDVEKWLEGRADTA